MERMVEIKRNGLSVRQAVAVSSNVQELLCLDQLVKILAIMQRC